ncbi:carbohydrate kinase [Botrimarina sp.]|uniref:carbohydrate kinase family protein n=1 Tax=Botrimarina sp. TaxID=2795802 RepID=UPI0032EB7127
MPPEPSAQTFGAPTPSPLVIGLGEALFDCFPDRTVLGGAPVNLAVHADALLRRDGGAGMPATRVGDDPLGKRFLDELTQRGVSTDAVQIDAERPTGTVQVRVDDQGQADYEFASNVAWDRLALDGSWQGLANRSSAVAFGTLAQRSYPSRETIYSFLEAAPQAIRLFDVNFRQSFYSPTVVRRSLELATAVKLNADELDEIVGLLGTQCDDSVDARALALVDGYDLEWLALTRGADGTAVYAGGKQHVADSPPPDDFQRDPDADTVGAGDACCAALLVGALHGWPIQQRIKLADRVGAFVASRAGATPELPPALIEAAAR